MVKWTVRAGVVLLVLAIVSVPALAKKKQGPLEYGTWKVRITPDADAVAKGEKATEDSLVLYQGVFRSEGWALHGFASVGYTMKDNAFTVDMPSGQNGKIHWSGIINGDSIAGRMAWTTKDGTVLNFTYSGTRAPEEPAKKKR